MRQLLSFLQLSPAAEVILTVAVMLLSGFAMTRLTRLARLPDVTAYILAGILIGPYGLELVPEDIRAGTEFLPDIALAFIAFSTGEFFPLSVLKKNGPSVIVVTLLEAVTASLLVFAACYWAMGLALPFSVVLAALASATAPASTMMTIRQTGAKGPFVDTLLQVVALDDVVGLIEYSVAISVAVAAAGGAGFSLGSVLRPMGLNLGVMILGGLFGCLLHALIHNRRSADNRLIISVALLFSFCGVCALADVSPLLGCMSMGMVYRNLAEDTKLFKQLNYFSPPILLLFFVRSGASFRLDMLLSPSSGTAGAVPLLTVGMVYFFVRVAGKYAGAYLGCRLTGKPKEVRRYLGLALVPQAGVAIGLAMLGARSLDWETGAVLQTVILASSVLYELVGPGCAKLSLYLSRSYTDRLEELVPAASLPDSHLDKTPVELLIQRIQAIQRELPARREPSSEEEQAFLEAAEEQLSAMRELRQHWRKRRF